MADARQYSESVTINGPITAASRKHIGEVIQAAEHQGRELMAQGQDPNMFTAHPPPPDQGVLYARLVERDSAAACVAKQMQDGPHSAMLGQTVGSGMTQQPRAPGKMFSCVEILAVLRSRKAVLVSRPHFDEACRELDTLIDVFERME